MFWEHPAVRGVTFWGHNDGAMWRKKGDLVRKDGADKVAGTARYVDDLTVPGMLHARTIRSTIPCGDIARIRLDFDTTGFTVVGAQDIPGRNLVALIQEDQPFLVEREVRHAEEPLLLLAHADRERLWQAPVRVLYAPRTPLFSRCRSAWRASCTSGATVWPRAIITGQS